MHSCTPAQYFAFCILPFFFFFFSLLAFDISIVAIDDLGDFAGKRAKQDAENYGSQTMRSNNQ